MDKIIYLDTETTGNSYDDRLFELAYKAFGQTYCEYFKPPLPISVKSQSITHVTNEMVNDKMPFSESKMKKDLEKILPDVILVAHSAEFDIDILEKEGLSVPNYICTMKVVRSLDESGEVPEYGLQFLRYFYKLNVPDAKAHDASSDIKVLESLFLYLFEKMKEKELTQEEILGEMIRVSKEPVLFKIISFGKYRGRRLEDVLAADRNYLQWLLEKKLESDFDETDWIFSLKHYLQISD